MCQRLENPHGYGKVPDTLPFFQVCQRNRGFAVRPDVVGEVADTPFFRGSVSESVSEHQSAPRLPKKGVFGVPGIPAHQNPRPSCVVGTIPEPPPGGRPSPASSDSEMRTFVPSDALRGVLRHEKALRGTHEYPEGLKSA